MNQIKINDNPNTKNIILVSMEEEENPSSKLFNVGGGGSLGV